MNRSLSLTKALVLVAIACTPALCAGGGAAPNQGNSQSTVVSQAGGCGATASSVDAELNLTDAQKKKIAAISAKYAAATKKLKDQYRAKSKSLDKVVSDPKSTEASIRKAVQALSQIQGELYVAKVMQKRDTEKVYTPAQRATLAKLGACGCGTSSSPSGGCGSGSSTNGASGGCGGGCGGG